MSDVPLSRGGRHALLIANGKHKSSDFPKLLSPRVDVENLAMVLGDRSLGGFEVETLFDQSHVNVKKKIQDLVRDKDQDDLILVYFSCHGVRDNRDGRLHFVARDSSLDYVGTTTVDAYFVNRMFSDSGAGMRVLILDSCFSGAFSRDFSPRGESVLGEVTGNGYVVITATDDFELARDGGLDEHGVAQMSPFTRAIVEGIATGSAARRGNVITIDDLGAHLRAARLPGQTPKFFAANAHGEMPISRVPAKPEPAAPVKPTPSAAKTMDAEAPERVDGARLIPPSRTGRLRERGIDHSAAAMAVFLGLLGIASGLATGRAFGASFVLGVVVFAVVSVVHLALSLTVSSHPKDKIGES